MKCIDVGCGIGEVTLELARWVGPNGHAVGIDFNEAFVETERQETKRRKPPAEFQVGTTAELSTERYDLAYARFLLTHLPRPDQALEEMARTVRPGGTIVVEDIDFAGH